MTKLSTMDTRFNLCQLVQETVSGYLMAYSPLPPEPHCDAFIVLWAHEIAHGVEYVTHQAYFNRSTESNGLQSGHYFHSANSSPQNAERDAMMDYLSRVECGY